MGARDFSVWQVGMQQIFAFINLDIAQGNALFREWHNKKTPWKTSLGSSYKPSGSSAYTSRDDIGSSRYTSLASPSTYRPSFSGGTYRVKRDPPSSLQTPSYTSRYTPSVSSRTTPVLDTSNDVSSTKSSQLKRYTSTATGKYGSSREPSPVALEITNRMRSREPSPVSRTLRGKSRDPSPVVDTSCKIGYGGLNSYRMSTPKPTSTSSYNGRYGGGGSVGRATSLAPTMPPDKSISYLTASDFHARSVSRARETAARKSNEKELEEEQTEAPKEVVAVSESDSSSADEEEKEEEKECFVAVSVVNRATSPTPPGSATTVQRTRRIDIAKTIEKTIQRSTRKCKTLDKEIQSDRLDDSTRYSRYGLSSRMPSYSPHTESRYTSSNLRYSASPLSATSKSTASNASSSASAEPKKEVATASVGKGTRSPSTNGKSKLSPPKVVRISSRQSSVENLASSTSANKPPAAPKAESPTKSSSSSGHVPTKLPNKDFRKSALNVGPTDRPRKSRTPSSGTDSDAVQQTHAELANGSAQRKERSPSAGSEVSNVSATSSKRSSTTGEHKPTRTRCHAKKSSSSSLSRHNSNNNLTKNASGAHKSCTPSTSTTTTSSSSSTSVTTASSSSGAESSSEPRKTNKKHGKKKTAQHTHNKEHRSTDNNSSSVTKCAATLATTDTGDANDSTTTKRTVDENSKRTMAARQQSARTEGEATESSRTNSKSPLAGTSSTSSANRLQKLSSVSNFFAARQCDANSEPIFIESSENSGGDSETGQLIISSLTAASKSSTSRTNNNATTTTTTTTDPASTEAATVAADLTEAAVSTITTSKRNGDNSSLDSTEDNTTARRSPRSLAKYSNESVERSRSTTTKSSSTHFPHETTVTDTAALTSEQITDSYTTTANTSTDEQEESSWWQDTSRQIDTASALGYHQKDDMRFKLRHIDSGETAWWLRNDEDDTLADDDLRTLNQEEGEEDAQSEATTAPTHSLTNNTTNSKSCSDQRNTATQSQAKYSWWTSDNIDEQEKAEGAHNENDQNETNYSNGGASAPCYKVNGESKQITRSHCTPEKPWWGESNENSKGDSGSGGRVERSSSASKQNGTIQLKICRVESGEKPWWLNEAEKEQNNLPAEEPVVEATIKLPARKSQTVERSTSSHSNSNSNSNSGNNVTSDDKRWWMSGPMKKQFTVRRVESGEKAWWQQNDDELASNSQTQGREPAAILTRDGSNENYGGRRTARN
ncbi:unnamed protein product [Ceratitis capitata]|uniref:(Mediterranean fruit fly) hypothetical protein n=1 Tax=Ceratitis capitata TaxID=7213 RepID=A0A811UUH4_CERCA|nr:unnamed protein product [Ceratitis capitata]